MHKMTIYFLPAPNLNSVDILTAKGKNHEKF